MACKGKKEVSEWESLFREADKDDNGSLDIMELKDLLKKNDSNLKDSQIADTFIFFDGAKGDKKITLEEFANGMKKFEEFYTKLSELFNKYDADGSGSLGPDELKKLLNSAFQKFTDAEVTEILNDADVNNDGHISMKEFLNACT